MIAHYKSTFVCFVLFSSPIHKIFSEKKVSFVLFFSMMKENTSCPMNLSAEFLNRSIRYFLSCEDEEAPFRGTWDLSVGPTPLVLWLDAEQREP